MHDKMSSRLMLELTLGTLTVAGFGFLYFYRQKKRRQQSIEDELKGSNRKMKKTLLPPPAAGGTVETEKVKENSKLTDVDTDQIIKTVLKEELEQVSDVDDEILVQNPLQIPLGMQEKAINFEIRISKHDIGSLIGKGGSNIRRIQRESNTRIIPRSERFENGDRMYTITGLPDAVGLAESKIRKHIMSQPVLNTVEMNVPAHSLGRIIGKRGENIRTIQDVSLTRIDIPEVDSDLGKDFTDDAYEFPKETNIRAIKIRGTEEQISHARKLIDNFVEEAATLLERIEATVATRTPRRNLNNTKIEADGDKSESSVPSIVKEELNLPLLRQNKTLEVFVSCVYHPNQFYIQIVGADVIKLDKLGKAMSLYYRLNPKIDAIETNFAVGDICAATFTDDNMYRGKILSLEGEYADILYVDYGDVSRLKTSELRKIRPDFLNVRFQAILSTLNLECLEEKWSNDSIDEMVELTKCVTWERLKAKVLGYLKDPSDCDTIWIEIYDNQDNSIADILIEKGLAASKEKKSIPNLTQPMSATKVSNSVSDSVNSSPSSSKNQNGIS